MSWQETLQAMLSPPVLLVANLLSILVPNALFQLFWLLLHLPPLPHCLFPMMIVVISLYMVSGSQLLIAFYMSVSLLQMPKPINPRDSTMKVLASHEKQEKQGNILLLALLSVANSLLSLCLLMVSLAVKLMQCFVSWLANRPRK